MVLLAQNTHLPPWSWRLRKSFGLFLDQLRSAPELTDVNSLSDRYLKDIGVERTDLTVAFDRETAELRRKGVGPFV